MKKIVLTCLVLVVFMVSYCGKGTDHIKTDSGSHASSPVVLLKITAEVLTTNKY